MPHLYGPSWPRRIDRRAERGSCEPCDEPPFVATGTTLAAVLFEYERQFKVKVVPYDGSLPEVPFAHGDEKKYFFYLSANEPSARLVDIHVSRNGVTFCVKQDLGLILYAGDIVELGQLVC